MDEEQFAILREWGEGLEREDRPELKAAGKAIRMLADEVEALTIELWEMRRALLDLEREQSRPEGPSVEDEGPAALTDRLRGRLRRANHTH